MAATDSAQCERGKVQVLLVVDDDDLRRVLSGAFCHRAMQVVVASTVDEVQSQLERRTFDVALVGTEFLNSDSNFLLSLMRRAQPTIQVIVLVTGLWFPENTPGLRLGAFDAVMTPGNPDALATKVLAAYGLRKLHAEHLALG